MEGMRLRDAAGELYGHFLVKWDGCILVASSPGWKVMRSLSQKWADKRQADGHVVAWNDVSMLGKANAQMCLFLRAMTAPGPEEVSQEEALEELPGRHAMAAGAGNVEFSADSESSGACGGARVHDHGGDDRGREIWVAEEELARQCSVVATYTVEIEKQQTEEAEAALDCDDAETTGVHLNVLMADILAEETAVRLDGGSQAVDDNLAPGPSVVLMSRDGDMTAEEIGGSSEATDIVTDIERGKAGGVESSTSAAQSADAEEVYNPSSPTPPLTLPRRSKRLRAEATVFTLASTKTSAGRALRSTTKETSAGDALRSTAKETSRARGAPRSTPSTTSGGAGTPRSTAPGLVAAEEKVFEPAFDEDAVRRIRMPEDAASMVAIDLFTRTGGSFKEFSKDGVPLDSKYGAPSAATSTEPTAVMPTEAAQLPEFAAPAGSDSWELHRLHDARTFSPRGNKGYTRADAACLRGHILQTTWVRKRHDGGRHGVWQVDSTAAGVGNVEFSADSGSAEVRNGVRKGVRGGGRAHDHGEDGRGQDILVAEEELARQDAVVAMPSTVEMMAQFEHEMVVPLSGVEEDTHDDWAGRGLSGRDDGPSEEENLEGVETLVSNMREQGQGMAIVPEVTKSNRLVTHTHDMRCSQDKAAGYVPGSERCAPSARRDEVDETRVEHDGEHITGGVSGGASGGLFVLQKETLFEQARGVGLASVQKYSPITPGEAGGKCNEVVVWVAPMADASRTMTTLHDGEHSTGGASGELVVHAEEAKTPESSDTRGDGSQVTMDGYGDVESSSTDIDTDKAPGEITTPQDTEEDNGVHGDWEMHYVITNLGQGLMGSFVGLAGKCAVEAT
jgi:hypothetical protein